MKSLRHQSQKYHLEVRKGVSFLSFSLRGPGGGEEMGGNLMRSDAI